MAAADLFLATPWLFLLLTVRALLPLNVSPLASVAITFALLGCLGWAGAARIVCAEARTLRNSDVVLLARASGCGGMRLLGRHIAPNLAGTLLAQFWLSVPVFSSPKPISAFSVWECRNRCPRGAASCRSWKA